MVHGRSFVWKCLTLLTLLGLPVITGACAPPPAVQEDQSSSWREDAELLALTGERRFFLLPLNNPGVVPAKAASHMEADDLVFGFVVDGQPRAYPRWIMVAYHVVNDTINEVPVVVAHCEACSGSAAFSPVLDGFGGKALAFQIYGRARGTFSIYDYQSQTVWSPFTGRTLEGHLHPSRMERIPLVVESWENWVKRYPETEVVLASRLMIERREHGRGSGSGMGGGSVAPVFVPSANMDDTRLPYGTLVLGITNPQGDKALAFPLELLETQEGLLKYQFDDRHYLVQNIGGLAVVAFRLSEEQQDKTYHVISENPFSLGDDAGRTWDEFGKSLNGTTEQNDLEAADAYVTEWYEWVSSYPQTEIAD